MTGGRLNIADVTAPTPPLTTPAPTTPAPTPPPTTPPPTTPALTTPTLTPPPTTRPPATPPPTTLALTTPTLTPPPTTPPPTQGDCRSSGQRCKIKNCKNFTGCRETPGSSCCCCPKSGFICGGSGSQFTCRLPRSKSSKKRV